jgi:hypothetical protein
MFVNKLMYLLPKANFSKVKVLHQSLGLGLLRMPIGLSFRMPLGLILTMLLPLFSRESLTLARSLCGCL